MTDEELKAIEERADLPVQYTRGDEGGDYVSVLWADDADEDRDALLAEVRRLRGLIKRVEEVDNDFGTMFCPWCVGCAKDHAADCPAFTPDGDVR
jgi:hypothetical protein